MLFLTSILRVVIQTNLGFLPKDSILIGKHACSDIFSVTVLSLNIVTVVILFTIEIHKQKLPKPCNRDPETRNVLGMTPASSGAPAGPCHRRLVAGHLSDILKNPALRRTKEGKSLHTYLLKQE